MSAEAFAYLMREQSRSAASCLPCNPSFEGQRESCGRNITGGKQGLGVFPGFQIHVPVGSMPLLAIKKAPRARQAARSLISEGISMDSLSKSMLLTENISHKSQVTGL